MKENDIYARNVTNKIIEALEKGTAPWQKSWSGAELSQSMPHNPVTKTQYKGINSLLLMLKNHEDTRWLTFKQASDLGHKVKKGEKSTTIVYSKFYELIDKINEKGEKVLDENQKPLKVKVILKRPKLFFSNVFNATQIEGIEALQVPSKDEIEEKNFSAIQKGEEILNTSQAKINHIFGDNAYYSPSTDSITLPLKEQFQSNMEYYSVALHELSHWTGHEDRLNRDLSGSFGSQSYAKEELRAEIGSFMLCSDLGVDFDPQNHYSYVDNWLKIIHDKPTEIFKASSDAEKIKEYLLSFLLEKEILNDTTQTITQSKNEPYRGSEEIKKDILTQQEEIVKAKEYLNSQREQNWLKISQKVSNEFEKASIPNKNHPYLKEKNISSYGIKESKNGDILIPLKDTEGKHWSNQIIKQNQDSHFQKGGKMGGNFALIGADSLKSLEKLIIAKDYASSATIFEATNIPVAMVGDINNLSSVTQNILKSNPKTSIIIALESDFNKSNNKEYLKGIEVAKKFGLKFISPTFTKSELNAKASNFNDLALLRGLKTLKRQISSIFEKEKVELTQNFEEKKDLKVIKENKKSIGIKL